MTVLFHPFLQRGISIDQCKQLLGFSLRAHQAKEVCGAELNPFDWRSLGHPTKRMIAHRWIFRAREKTDHGRVAHGGFGWKGNPVTFAAQNSREIRNAVIERGVGVELGGGCRADRRSNVQTDLMQMTRQYPRARGGPRRLLRIEFVEQFGTKRDERDDMFVHLGRECIVLETLKIRLDFEVQKTIGERRRHVEHCRAVFTAIARRPDEPP